MCYTKLVCTARNVRVSYQREEWLYLEVAIIRIYSRGYTVTGIPLKVIEIPKEIISVFNHYLIVGKLEAWYAMVI